MAEIIVSHGLCTPIRPKVLTALEPYAFKGLKVQAWGEGRFGKDDSTSKTKDTDKLARQHYARITVSDDAAKWAEWLLWQSGQFALDSKPLNPRLNWVAPKNCKEQSSLGRGTMPTPWRDKQRAPRTGGLLSGLFDGLRRKPRRQQRRSR